MPLELSSTTPQYANKKVAQTTSRSDSSMIRRSQNYEDGDDAADSSIGGSKMTISNSRACVRACVRAEQAGRQCLGSWLGFVGDVGNERLKDEMATVNADKLLQTQW